MTNTLVGDVYLKIIEEVVAASTIDFEERGVGSNTLEELQQEWQAKLTARGVAQMPWDPKPVPVQQPPAAPSQMPPVANNGVAPANYPTYDQNPGTQVNGAARVKAEPGTEPQFHGLPSASAYPPQNGAAQTQGGLARAQQLVQQQYGNAVPRGGLALALPGQQARPQSQAPAAVSAAPGNLTAQQQFQQQQQQAMQRQQQALQQQQAPRPAIKTENDQPNYSQTDGADDSEDMRQWREMLAARRALNAEQQRQYADRMMHEQITQMSSDLSNGLMLERSSPRPRPAARGSSQRNKAALQQEIASSSQPSSSSTSALPRSSTIPQYDGEDDDDEDDENAINSDLDDSDEDAQGNMGDDDEDEGDAILCTYDKVQRVKNKWKCTLKDGVMIVNGKDWVFHKGMGEFEW